MSWNIDGAFKGKDFDTAFDKAADWALKGATKETQDVVATVKIMAEGIAKMHPEKLISVKSGGHIDSHSGYANVTITVQQLYE